MEDMIELATYIDSDYGEVIQFLDQDGNPHFYSLEVDENSEKKYNEFDDVISSILEKKYFSIGSDDEYE